MLNRVAVPAAILIGSAMLSAAVYFGLQNRGGPVHQQSPAPVVGTQEVYDRVAADARKTLESSRQTMAATCLHGTTKALRFKFRMGFNAHGKEIIRGISLDGDGPAEVASCLTDHFPPAIVVPAPGAKVSVVAELELP